MKLQQILSSLQKLHPKEIDLSLDRIKKLCNKLGNPQDNLQYISVVGTNGKYSTIQAIRAILKDANINCNIYTSPHIQKINERFIYNDEEISDENLAKLLTEVEDINAGEPITYFEILTAAYFYNARNFKNNINLIESGLFHRADACSIIKSNLASVVTAIGLDHLDWLPQNKQSIDQIIFEKTSKLLESKIIISNQSDCRTLEKIKKSLKLNKSKKILDIGTGSGCIIISILKERPKCSATAIDISRKAIFVAKTNAKIQQVSNRIRFIKSDVDKFLLGKYDLIISNPPYIKQLEINDLDKDIKNHDNMVNRKACLRLIIIFSFLKPTYKTKPIKKVKQLI